MEKGKGSTARRLRVATLIALTTALFAPAIVTQADEASGVTPALGGEGWYWESRQECDPPEGAEAACTAANTFWQNLVNRYAGDHLYVGWDSAGPTEFREQISGLSFDLFDAGVPDGSIISSFILTLVEHPMAADHNTTAPANARAQGVIACPWPEFFGGTPGAPFTDAPLHNDKVGGGCAEARAVGAPNPPDVDTTNPEKQYVWTFDLTDIVGNLWASGENIGISLEPGTEAPSAASWTTAFHASTYSVPDENGDPVRTPGVKAKVSWVPPPDDGFGDSSLGGTGSTSNTETFTEFFGESGGDTGGGFIEVPGETPGQSPPGGGTSTPQRSFFAGGNFEGASASFWNIPWYGWIIAAAAVLFLFFSGSTVIQPVAATSRPKGAIGKLVSEESENS